MTNKNKWLIAIGSFVATAAAVFFIKKNKTGNEDKPPKGAPQLNIENPGHNMNSLNRQWSRK